MNSTETKAAIVNALKDAGFNSKKVSVSIRRGGYESQVILTIRDASVSAEQVEEIAESFSKVQYCEKTGEILAGGNVFTHVRKFKG